MFRVGNTSPAGFGGQVLSQQAGWGSLVHSGFWGMPVSQFSSACLGRSALCLPVRGNARGVSVPQLVPVSHRPRDRRAGRGCTLPERERERERVIAGDMGTLSDAQGASWYRATHTRSLTPTQTKDTGVVRERRGAGATRAPHAVQAGKQERERERAALCPNALQASKQERERERERRKEREREREREQARGSVGVAAGSEFLALSLCRSLRSLVHFTIKLRAVYCVLLIARWLVAWHMFQ